MNHIRSLFLVIFFGACSSSGWGADASAAQTGVSVEIFSMPEAVWQTSLSEEAGDAVSLEARLTEEVRAGKARREVAADLKLRGAEVQTWKQGEEKEFVKSWEPAQRPDDKLQPRERLPRFIGTVIEARAQEVGGEEVLHVDLKFAHDVAQPVLLPINYANAATGPERERLSVAYPRFEKLEWNGNAVAGKAWRLVSQILRPQRDTKDITPATRYFIFIKQTRP